jgi:hypothetical protein
MANVRITTNTTGTQPVIVIGLDGANLANTTQALTLPFVQDVTITNSTGVYAYTTFTDVDTRKLSTPADNEISTNIVVDATTYFGTNPATGTLAPELGVAYMSTNKSLIDFKIYWNGTSAGAHFYEGTGFFTSLAPTTSPDAPVWVTPLTIAVDGAFTSGTVPGP